MSSLSRTDEEIREIYHRHVDAVYRVCYSFLKNKTDTEDMVQETFLRLLSGGKQFESENHEKAWLIVTASNLCKDALKHWWRKREDIENCSLPQEDALREADSTLGIIMNLPQDYKVVVYLYYYEGYSTPEIARFLHCPQVTVRSRLSRARKRLKSMIGGELDDQTETMGCV